MALFGAVLSSRAQTSQDGTDKERVNFEVHADEEGKVIPNVTDNINVWNYKQEWGGKNGPDFAGYFQKQLPFVKYVQFMMAAGGSEERDLFVHPQDRSVMDDYDFTPLVEACRNVVAQGLTPHLKIGNVPLKYSSKPKISRSFGVNLLPPDSYDVWRNYVYALGQALVEAFGRQEVLTWRFGVLTEYENKDWFSVDDNPEATRTAYLKLYDYTVDALQKAIGKQVCVGGHSMTVSEGLWDERDFITHCARGTNYCTGKKGTRLCFLSSSYYDPKPGAAAERSLPECIDHLRQHAEKEGLKGLFYGVDEGRILQGTDHKDLDPRAIGNTWQAAYDMRMFKTLIDHDIDYFSQWKFTTAGLWGGVPSVSQQAATLLYAVSGKKRLRAERMTTGTADTGCIAAKDTRGKKLYLLFYAYSDSVDEQGEREVCCQIKGLPHEARRLNVWRTLISDESNFFDEWERDQKELGLTDDDFGWSRSSYVLTVPTLKSQKHINYAKSREAYYAQCATLRREPSHPLAATDGQTLMTFTMPVHGVALYEIDLSDKKPQKQRSIAKIGAIKVEAPEGTVPRLPWQVWVTYSDGTGEWRQATWTNHMHATEQQQADKTLHPAGSSYEVKGFVIGDNATDSGFPIVAKVNVTERPWDVPGNEPVARPLPLADVMLTGTNRLTHNRDLDIQALLALDITQQLYNYRDTYGLPTEGYTEADGWDSPNTKLKGHGSGHYMSALAFAFASCDKHQETATKTALRQRMRRMVDELRACQERTFVWDAGRQRYLEARDYMPESEMPGLKGTWAAFDEYKKDYRHYGYGYLNAIPAAHPVLIEKYSPYNNEEGVWAPYYTIHKQLAGLIDIANNVDDKAIADKALLIAKDMGLWVWNRMHYRTYVKTDGDKAQRQARPGNRFEMWNMYIAGEVGGMAESLARLGEMVADSTEKARLVEAANCFDTPALFDPLARNIDDIRTRHANQHIPMITGALRTYTLNRQPYYYNIAHNFWHLVQGRYAYAMGGVGNGEMFRQPYSQMLSMNTNVMSDSQRDLYPNPDMNETCCAYNLAKLSKDLNTFDPDNAQYMDYYERLLYNQIVGSLHPDHWAVTYQYAVGMNAIKPYGNETPQSTCCGGTGAESHVKYQEAAYFVDGPVPAHNGRMEGEGRDHGAAMPMACRVEHDNHPHRPSRQHGPLHAEAQGALLGHGGLRHQAQRQIHRQVLHALLVCVHCRPHLERGRPHRGGHALRHTHLLGRGQDGPGRHRQERDADALHPQMAGRRDVRSARHGHIGHRLLGWGRHHALLHPAGDKANRQRAERRHRRPAPHVAAAVPVGQTDHLHARLLPDRTLDPLPAHRPTLRSQEKGKDGDRQDRTDPGIGTCPGTHGQPGGMERHEREGAGLLALGAPRVCTAHTASGPGGQHRGTPRQTTDPGGPQQGHVRPQCGHQHHASGQPCRAGRPQRTAAAAHAGQGACAQQDHSAPRGHRLCRHGGAVCERWFWHKGLDLQGIQTIEGMYGECRGEGHS